MSTAPVFEKYIVVLLPTGEEQAVRFPTTQHHDAVAKRFGLPVISAGFCCDDSWIGGESETLKIGSRKKDIGLLVSMLLGPARAIYDLMPAIDPQVFNLDEPGAISFP